MKRWFIERKTIFTTMICTYTCLTAAVGCAGEGGSESTAPSDTAATEAAGLGLAASDAADDRGANGFRVIFFGIGPYRDKLPQVWNPQTAPFRDDPAYIQAGERIVNLVRERQPTFFSYFGSALFSHDVVRVDTALANALTGFKSVTSELPSHDGLNLLRVRNRLVDQDRVCYLTYLVHDFGAEKFADPYTRMQLAANIVQTWQ